MECKIVANCKIIEPLVKNYDVDHSYHGLWNNISVRVYIIYTNKLYANQEILKEELYVQ